MISLYTFIFVNFIFWYLYHFNFYFLNINQKLLIFLKLVHLLKSYLPIFQLVIILSFFITITIFFSFSKLIFILHQFQFQKNSIYFLKSLYLPIILFFHLFLYFWFQKLFFILSIYHGSKILLWNNLEYI